MRMFTIKKMLMGMFNDIETKSKPYKVPSIDCSSKTESVAMVKLKEVKKTIDGYVKMYGDGDQFRTTLDIPDMYNNLDELIRCNCYLDNVCIGLEAINTSVDTFKEMQAAGRKYLTHDGKGDDISNAIDDFVTAMELLLPTLDDYREKMIGYDHALLDMDAEWSQLSVRLTVLMNSMGWVETSATYSIEGILEQMQEARSRRSKLMKEILAVIKEIGMKFTSYT